MDESFYVDDDEDVQERVGRAKGVSTMGLPSRRLVVVFRLRQWRVGCIQLLTLAFTLTLNLLYTLRFDLTLFAAR